MGISELTRRMFVNFFVIFFLIIATISVFSWFAGDDTIGLSAIFNTSVLSFFIVLTEFVFYSKKELTRLQWLVRHLICLLLVVVIVLIFLFLIGGVRFPVIIHNAILIIIVYPISFVIDYIRTVKSTGRLEKKLQERYK